ncbi:MAG TPA: pyridoxamine 5'-phosphate oxidase family protein, partial [Actinomycetota bacterium]|nr:pyridoxamine 5'-phosphate oxidase family protein [Actinomycetota bacterium]
DIRSPGTVANLRQNPSVEINVVDPLSRKGYRFKGTAQVLEQGLDFESGIAFFRERGVTSPIRSVVMVRITRALAVTSPAYDAGASESEIRARWSEFYGRQPHGNTSSNSDAIDG